MFQDHLRDVTEVIGRNSENPNNETKDKKNLSSIDA